MYDIFDGFDENEFLSEDDRELFDHAAEGPHEAEELEGSPLEAEDLDDIEKMLDDDEEFDWPVTPAAFTERRRKSRFGRWADEEDFLLPGSFGAGYADAVVDKIKDILDSERVFSVESRMERECICVAFDTDVQEHEVAAAIVVDENTCCVLFKPRAVKVFAYETELRSFMDARNHRQRYGKFSVDPADGHILLDHSICIAHGFNSGDFRQIWDELNVSLLKLVQEYDFLGNGMARSEEEKKILSIRV